MSTSFIFQPKVKVPDHVFDEICKEVKAVLLEKIDADPRQLYDAGEIGYFVSSAAREVKRGRRVVGVEKDICKKLEGTPIRKMCEALETERFILAVKIFREYTGKGLKDSKDFIERFGEDNQVRAKNLKAAFAE